MLGHALSRSQRALGQHVSATRLRRGQQQLQQMARPGAAVFADWSQPLSVGCGGHTVTLRRFSGQQGEGGPTSGSSDVDKKQVKKPGAVRKFISKYGMLGLGFHTSIWVASFSMFYGVISAVGVEPVFAALDTAGTYVPYLANAAERIPASAATAGAALVCTEATDPIRLPLTVLVTPKLRRWLDARAAAKQATEQAAAQAVPRAETQEATTSAAEAQTNDAPRTSPPNGSSS